MSAPTEVTHAFRVESGVTLLDLKLDRDVWLPRVNLDTLDVASSVSCILCQATGISWYADAVDHLRIGDDIVRDWEGVRPEWTQAHGFGISLKTLEDTGRRDFSGLQAEWVRKITELRAKAGDSAGMTS